MHLAVQGSGGLLGILPWVSGAGAVFGEGYIGCGVLPEGLFGQLVGTRCGKVEVREEAGDMRFTRDVLGR